MLGRFRPPPSPPDFLERSPVKIVKHDPLSVYESTLLKLKQGSRLDHGSLPETWSEVSSETEGENVSDVSASSGIRHTDVIPCLGKDPMAIDLGSSDCESGGCQKQQKNKNASLLYMFSRYKCLVHTRSLSPRD